MCSTFVAVLIGCNVPLTQSSPFAGSLPVSDSIMADVRGGSITPSWLAVAATDEFRTQGQLTGETLRSSMDNWFADSNSRLLANAAISR